MKACGGVYAGARAAVHVVAAARVAGGRRRAGQTAQDRKVGIAAARAVASPLAALGLLLPRYHVPQMSSRKLPLL